MFLVVICLEKLRVKWAMWRKRKKPIIHWAQCKENELAKPSVHTVFNTQSKWSRNVFVSHSLYERESVNRKMLLPLHQFVFHQFGACLESPETSTMAMMIQWIGNMQRIRFCAFEETESDERRRTFTNYFIEIFQGVVGWVCRCIGTFASFCCHFKRKRECID